MGPIIDVPGASALSAAVTPLVERFRAAGHRIHLVGGVVRDLLLGNPPLDLDFTTDARPEEIKEMLAPWADDLWTQGERFGTIGARRDGVTYEITTYRAESYDPSSRKPTVRFGDDLVGDLERRDFTINSMAIDLPEFALVDPHGGQADLAARRLRTPLSPEIAFDDDPLRMLRAARFAARFGLTVEPGVVAAMRDRCDRIAIVSAERIHDELLALLAAPDPRVGLDLLAETGLLAEILPEAGERDGALLGARTPLGRLAGLVRASEPEQVGARMRALRSSHDETAAVVTAVRLLPSLTASESASAEPSEGSVRRLIVSAGSHLDVLLDAGRAVRPTAVDRFERVRGRLAESEDLNDLGPGLDGTTAGRILDVAPGPIIGRALRFLADIRLDEGTRPTAELEQRLRDWAGAAASPGGEPVDPP